MKNIITIYKAKDGYRWRMTVGKHIIGDSGEAYTTMFSLEKSLRNMIMRFMDRKYVIIRPIKTKKKLA